MSVRWADQLQRSPFSVTSITAEPEPRPITSGSGDGRVPVELEDGRQVHMKDWLAEWIEDLRSRLPSFKLSWTRKELQQALGDIGYLDELPESQLQLLEAFLKSSRQQDAALALVLDEQFMDDRVKSTLERLDLERQGLSRPTTAGPDGGPVAGHEGFDDAELRARLPMWMWGTQHGSLGEMHQAAIVIQQAFRRWRAAQRRRKARAPGASRWDKVKARYMEGVDHSKPTWRRSKEGDKEEDKPQISQASSMEQPQASPAAELPGREPIPPAVWEALELYSLLHAVLSKLHVGLLAARHQVLSGQQQQQQQQQQGQQQLGGEHRHQGQEGQLPKPQHQMSKQAKGKGDKGLEASSRGTTKQAAAQTPGPGSVPAPALAPTQHHPEEQHREVLEEVASLLAEAADCTAGLDGPGPYRLLLSSAVQLGLPLPPPMPAVDDASRSTLEAYRQALANIKRASSPGSALLAWASQLLHLAMDTPPGATLAPEHILKDMPQDKQDEVEATQLLADSPTEVSHNISFANSTEEGGAAPLLGGPDWHPGQSTRSVGPGHVYSSEEFGSSRASSASPRGRGRARRPEPRSEPGQSHTAPTNTPLLAEAAGCTAQIIDREQYSALLMAAMQLGLPLPPPPAMQPMPAALTSLYRSALASLRHPSGHIARLSQQLYLHVHGVPPPGMHSAGGAPTPSTGDQVSASAMSANGSFASDGSTLVSSANALLIQESSAASFASLSASLGSQGGAEPSIPSAMSDSELLEVYCMVMSAVQTGLQQQQTQQLHQQQQHGGHAAQLQSDQGHSQHQASSGRLTVRAIPSGEMGPPGLAAFELPAVQQHQQLQQEPVLPTRHSAPPVVAPAPSPRHSLRQQMLMHRTSAVAVEAEASIGSQAWSAQSQAGSSVYGEAQEDVDQGDEMGAVTLGPQGSLVAIHGAAHKPARYAQQESQADAQEGEAEGDKEEGAVLEQEENDDVVGVLPGADTWAKKALEAVEHQLQLLANHHLGQARVVGSPKSRRTLLRFLQAASSTHFQAAPGGAAGDAEHAAAGQRPAGGIWRWVHRMITDLEDQDAAEEEGMQHAAAAGQSTRHINSSTRQQHAGSSGSVRPQLLFSNIHYDASMDKPMHDAGGEGRLLLRGHSVGRGSSRSSVTRSAGERRREALEADWQRTLKAAGHQPANPAVVGVSKPGLFISRIQPQPVAPSQRLQHYHDRLRTSTSRREPGSFPAAAMSPDPTPSSSLSSRTYTRTSSEPMQRHEQAAQDMQRTMSVPVPPPQLQRWPSNSPALRATPHGQQRRQQQPGLPPPAPTLFPAAQRIPLPGPFAVPGPSPVLSKSAEVPPSLSAGGRRLLASSSFQMHPRLLSYQRIHQGHKQELRQQRSSSSQQLLSQLSISGSELLQPVTEDVIELPLSAPAAARRLPGLSAAQAFVAQTQSKAQRRVSVSNANRNRLSDPGRSKRISAPQ